MSDQDDLISIYQAANAIEANLVRNLLDEQGIEAAVSDENEPLAGLPIVPPDVLVRRSDQARAEALVIEYDRQKSQQQTAPDWKCPACGAQVPATFDECDQCGANRPGAN